MDEFHPLLMGFRFAPKSVVAAPHGQTLGGGLESCLHADQVMGLNEQLLTVPLEDRFSYDEAENLLFMNLEGLEVNTRDELEAVRSEIDDASLRSGAKSTSLSTTIICDSRRTCSMPIAMRPASCRERTTQASVATRRARSCA